VKVEPWVKHLGLKCSQPGGTSTGLGSGRPMQNPSVSSHHTTRVTATTTTTTTSSGIWQNRRYNTSLKYNWKIKFKIKRQEMVCSLPALFLHEVSCHITKRIPISRLWIRDRDRSGLRIVTASSHADALGRLAATWRQTRAFPTILNGSFITAKMFLETHRQYNTGTRH